MTNNPVDEKKIEKRMKEICQAEKSGSYGEIKERLLDKRLNWYKKNDKVINKLEGTDVHKAFEMVLFKYMRLKPKEVPVVYEDKEKIVWRSYNWCPVLEACKRLKLDTRKVCKKGWEESIQRLIEGINPKLKFTRNYDILRPHGKYCEESIELKK